MSNRIKNFIGVAAVVGVIVFSYAAWVYVDAFSKSIEPSSFRSFSVSAEGEVVAIPDVAQFTFQVITQGGADIADLQTQNVEKTNNAIAFVKSQGVEGKDIKTQNFSLDPRYQYYNCSPRPLGEKTEVCPPPEIVGYTITQTVQVKVRDFTTIGTIISGVVENGANSVSQLSFVIDNPDGEESKARAQAIEKAREKAKAVAKAGGFSVGRLLSIQEGGGFPVYNQFYEKAALDYGMGGAVPSAPLPSIEPGSQEVKVSVTLVYEIE